MKIYLVSRRRGYKKWNYNDPVVVRAASEERAVAMCRQDDREEWVVEEVPVEGHEETILGCWNGDMG